MWNMGRKGGKNVVLCSMGGININLQLFCKTTFLFMFPKVCFKMLCMHANVLQSCSTLCEPMDCSPLGSSVHGILQTRILEWVAIPFSKGSSQPRDRTWLFHFAGRLPTIWTTRAVLWLPYTCIFLLLILPFLNLLICLCVSHSVVSDPLWPYGL